VNAPRLRLTVGCAALAALVVLAASALVPLPREAGAFAQERSAPAAAKQGAAGSTTDEQAVRKASAGYLEAMNKGDLEARLAFWAPDAEYVNEAGKVTRGREALAALLKKGIADLKGTKVTGKINSLKFLRPDTAIVDGVLEFTSPDGSKDSDRYLVVWTKSGERWLISSAHDVQEETNEVPSLAYLQLKQLDWLVGEWQDQSDKVDVNIACRWDRNKAFLLLDYEIKQPGQDALQVTVRVGWDGRNGMVRSWVFDSGGGFGEGYWERDGNRWVVGAAGILPDGGTGSATYVYEFVDTNNFVWRSFDREVDGQPMSDAEVKFSRKAAK